MIKYHYTYRITHIVDKKHYYGTRTSKIHPKEDLGIKYFSSSTNKDFIKDQKSNPQNYKYKIIRISNNRKDSLQLEIKLHNKFNVGSNESFYNKSKQTSTGFDTTGIIPKHLFDDNGKLRKEIYDKMVDFQRKSPSMKGKNQSDHQKEVASNTHKGKKITEEQKQKIRNNPKFIESRKCAYEKSLKIYYENNPSPCQKTYKIFDKNDNLVFEFNDISLRNFCKKKSLPYTSLYKSKCENGSKLYQTSYLLNKVKKKGWGIYEGWYCIGT